MGSDINRQWRVARFPEPGDSISAGNFQWREESVPKAGDGEFLVRTLCLAPGPAQRGYIDPGHQSILEKVNVGDVMRGRGVGQVIESKHEDYAAGDIFVGSLGWQDYSIQKPQGAAFVFSSKKIIRRIRPTEMILGILGQAGVTAFFGVKEHAKVEPGNAFLVSAAAGGVGSVVGQIARIQGASPIVGIASSDEKCAWLCDALGYDQAINYKKENVADRLTELFPNGIDVFFDNVGGEILDEALAHLAFHARVVICGFISTDYAAGPQHGPYNYRHLLYKRATMQGFVFFDYWDRYAEAESALVDWYEQGLLKPAEDIDDGLELMPESLGSLFSGGNRGIKICRVAPDPD